MAGVTYWLIPLRNRPALMLLFVFFSDQHLGTRGDTLFYDGGITDVAGSEATPEQEQGNNLKGKDVDSHCLIRYLLQFCLCLLKEKGGHR